MLWLAVALAVIAFALLFWRCSRVRPAPVVREPDPVVPSLPLAPDPLPRYRVLRYRNGELVECLAQGGGARCRVVWEAIDAVEPGEEIRFMDGNNVRSAKQRA